MKPSCGLTYLFRRLPLATLLAWMGVAGLEMPVHAGGGPENLLLVVNPIDEGSLRVANAYVAARHIPINNILYITPPSYNGYYSMGLTTTDLPTLYQTPILNYIAAHGLSQQIDYISTLGQPYSCNNSGRKPSRAQDCLNQLTQLKNGMTLAQERQHTARASFFRTRSCLNNPISFTYVPGTNAAIHHSQVLPAHGCGRRGTDHGPMVHERHDWPMGREWHQRGANHPKSSAHDSRRWAEDPGNGLFREHRRHPSRRDADALLAVDPKLAQQPAASPGFQEENPNGNAAPIGASKTCAAVSWAPRSITFLCPPIFPAHGPTT